MGIIPQNIPHNMELLLLASCLTLTLGGDIPMELTTAGATILIELVTEAGLGDTLAGEGPFTIFAPTNDAFAKLPDNLMNTLKGDPELLKQVLLNHVVTGTINSENITNDLTVETVGGGVIRENVYLKSRFYDGFFTVNGARISKSDLVASNGVIHLVSDVLYPFPPETTITEVISADSKFSTLNKFLSMANLSSVLSQSRPYTVFAPTNDAFDKVPATTLASLLSDKGALTKVLLRHVVPGTVYSKGIYWGTYNTAGEEGGSDDQIATQVFRASVVRVVSSSAGVRKSASVIETDILATNGVIHAIDDVI